MKRHFTDTNASSFFRAKRQKQEEYAASTFEKMKTEIKRNLLETVEPEKFDNNLKRLILSWTGEHCSMSDCEGTRLVNKFIRHTLHNPLTVAIIADDENKFFELFNPSKKEALPASLPELMGFACLSGAGTIVSKLLGNNEVMSKCSTELIAYAVSSGNRELALKVSTFFLDRGEKDPGLIYLYSGGKPVIANEVNNLFKENAENVRPSMT